MAECLFLGTIAAVVLIIVAIEKNWKSRIMQNSLIIMFTVALILLILGAGQVSTGKPITKLKDGTVYTTEFQDRTSFYDTYDMTTHTFHLGLKKEGESKARYYRIAGDRIYGSSGEKIFKVPEKFRVKEKRVSGFPKDWLLFTEK